MNEPEKNAVNTAADTPDDFTPPTEEELKYPRKVGVARFFELMGRDLWSFYKAGFLCLPAFAPGFAAVVLGIMMQQPLLCIVGGLVGGVIAGPVLCGLVDTILRALRDEPGYWWHTYRTAWKQNWKDSLIPGGMLGLFLGLWCYLLSALPNMEQEVPITVWICLLIGLVIAAGIVCYLFAQTALVALPLGQKMKNAGLFYIGFLPRSLAASLVTVVYWGLVLLYMPYTMPLTLVTGFWFPTVIAVQIIYPALDRAFQLEKTIQQRRDAELDAHLAQRTDDV